jgi:hypothetical protein
MKSLIIVGALLFSANCFAETTFSNFPTVNVNALIKSGVTKDDLQSKIDSCQKDLDQAVSKLTAAGYSVLEKQACTGNYYEGGSIPGYIITSGYAQFVK